MGAHSWSDAEPEIAIEIVASRSPEHFTFGMFSWLDIAPILAGSGMGAFGWFETQDECMDFIVEVLATHGPDGTSEEGAEEARALLDEHGLTRSGLAALTALRLHGVAYEWAGSFMELLSGSGEFVEQKRAQFRDGESGAPIDDAERADFIAWLPEAGI